MSVKFVSNINVDGNITSDSFVKEGGTSSQFLKADGSIDTNTYSTSAGTVGGSGADNRLPKFSTGGNNVENSTISDDGTDVSLSEGRILLNDTTFNQIKSSGNTQYVGTTNGVNTLKIGTSTTGWKSVTTDSGSSEWKNGGTSAASLNHTNGNMTLEGSLTADSIIKDGGTSSQFLKADGSVDSTTYATGTIPTNNNQLTNGENYITSGDIPSIPSNTSDLNNDSGFITSGITGSGTSGTFPLWTSTGVALSNSSMTQDSTDIIMTKPLTVSGGAGDAIINLVSDPMNTDENDNCMINFSQDGGGTLSNIGLIGDSGSIYSSSLSNSLGMGTDTANPVQLYTNSAARMTIQSNGDVGIGTNNPIAMLDVNGDSNFTGNAKFESTFGNLDTTNDKGMQFEIGTSALNTLRTDADAFRIYFGGTSANGEALKITQAGLMTLKTQGSTEFQWDLDGDFHADGDVIAYSTTVSDRNLKENINTIENATETVEKLRGVQYEWKQGSGKREGQTEIGVIAQEVEEILPFLVREKKVKDNVVKTVDYEKMIGLLIESNKELSARLRKLECGCSTCDCK